MSKRAACVQLTSDNYEEDEKDCDQPGRFEEASEEELKHRVIKRAARRTNAMSNGREGGLFAGFKMTAPLGSGAGLGLLGGGALSTGSGPLQKTSPEDGESGDVSSAGSVSSNGGSEYFVQLRALNVGVSQWISSHVDKNPHVDLTPIFRDYEKHLKTIDLKYKPVVSEPEGSEEVEGSEEAEESSQEVDSGDSCSQVTTETDAATTGDDHVESVKETPSSAPSSQESADSLLAVRAKLFYKKAEEFNELGLGTLKVQSSSGQSVRLLLRNDTSIGNVLLNVKLTSNVPMTRNKNNVMIVCQANPPLGKDTDDKAVTYLLRVKTEDLATRLYTVIKDSFV